MTCALIQLWSLRTFPALPLPFQVFGSVAATLILLRSPAFLEQALTTEQYTLLTGLLAFILLVATLLVRTEFPPGARVRTRLLSLMLGVLCGLAIGNHPSQLCLGMLVAVVLWSAASMPHRPGKFLELGFVCGMGVLLGLLVFAWIPIRAPANPLLDYGNVHSLERFLALLGRKQWEPRPLTEAPRGFVTAWLTTYDFAGQLGWLGLLLAVAGLFVLVTRDKQLLLWLAAVALPYAGGMLLAHLKQKNIDVNYVRQYGVIDWHLPLYLTAATAAGIGLCWVIETLRRRHVLLGTIAAVFVGTALIVDTGISVHRSSLRNFRAPAEFIRTLLEPLPDDAIVLVGTDNLAHMLSYVTYVAHSNGHRWVAYDIDPITAAIEAADRSGGWNSEKRIRHLTQTVVNPDIQPLRIPPLALDRARSGPLFTEFSPRYPGAARWLLPAGFLFQVMDHPTGDQEVREADQKWRRDFPGSLKRPTPHAARLEREAWALLYQWRGGFFAARGMWEEAGKAYEQALEWFNENGDIWYCLAGAQDRLGKTKDAIAAYAKAIDVAPQLPGPRVNLAILFADSGDAARAEMLLQDELRIDPNSEIAKANLKLIRETAQRRQNQKSR